MFTKSLLLVGAVTLFTLPVKAQDVNPTEFPNLQGQLPCSSFVIERIIDGERFVAYPEQDGVTLVTLYNDSIYGTKVEIDGKDYSEIRIKVTEGGLRCIVTPLDETDSAASS